MNMFHQLINNHQTDSDNCHFLINSDNDNLTNSSLTITNTNVSVSTTFNTSTKKFTNTSFMVVMYFTQTQ